MGEGVWRLQVRSYPSSATATSATTLAALLYSAPPVPTGSSASSASPHRTPRPGDSSALRAARAQLAAALAESADGAKDAATLCLQLADACDDAASGAAATLCVRHAHMIGEEHLSKLTAYALETCDANMLSQLLALRRSRQGGDKSDSDEREKSPATLLKQLAHTLDRAAPDAANLQTQLAACFADVRSRDVGNAPPTMGHAAPAVLTCSELLRCHGVGASLLRPSRRTLHRHNDDVQPQLVVRGAAVQL